MALSLAQIFRSLISVGAGKDGEDRFDRAARVRVVQLKKGTSRSTGLVTFLCKTSTPERGPSGRLTHDVHVTSIAFLTKAKVKVSCSCPDFWSKWEYNLARKGSADIIYGNGDAPTTRIPIGCCKHVVKLSDYCVRAGHFTGNFELKDAP